MPTAPDSPDFAPRPTRLDTFRARLMFVLGFVFLLVVAGLIHRSTSETVTLLELDAMYVALAFLWPVFVADLLWGLYRRDRSKPARPVFLRALLVAIMPPWR